MRRQRRDIKKAKEVEKCPSSLICFEGNFGNLGTDITHAPSSLVNHPDELAETLGAGALIAAPFVLPEIGGALGIGAGADAATAAGTGGLAADLGIGDIGAAAAADTAAGAGTAALDTGLAAGTDALALAPETADALALAPEADAALPDASTLATGSLDIPGATDAAGTDAVAADTGTPVGFAPTDAELSGGVTGTAPAAGGGASTGGGITSMLGDALKSPYTKLGLGLAPLALTLARGEPSLPSQVNPAVANATALANQGASLNSSQQATLDQMRQNAINAARQALYNQGVQNPESDTRYSQMVSNIDSQVTAAAQTMIQQNIQNSLQGDAVLTQVASMQMTADQNFTNTLVNATKALGTVAGLGSGVTLKVGS